MKRERLSNNTEEMLGKDYIRNTFIHHSFSFRLAIKQSFFHALSTTLDGFLRSYIRSLYRLSYFSLTIKSHLCRRGFSREKDSEISQIRYMSNWAQICKSQYELFSSNLHSFTPHVSQQLHSYFILFYFFWAILRETSAAKLSLQWNYELHVFLHIALKSAQQKWSWKTL